MSLRTVQKSKYFCDVCGKEVGYRELADHLVDTPDVFVERIEIKREHTQNMTITDICEDCNDVLVSTLIKLMPENIEHYFPQNNWEKCEFFK